MQNSIWVLFLIARFIGNENIDDLWWREHQTTKQEYFEQRKCHLIMQLVKVITIARERRKIFNILVSSKELLWFYTRHFHRSFTAFLHTYIGTFIPQKNNAPLRAIELWLRLSSTAFTAVSVTRLDFYQTNQIKKNLRRKKKENREITQTVSFMIFSIIFFPSLSLATGWVYSTCQLFTEQRRQMTSNIVSVCIENDFSVILSSDEDSKTEFVWAERVVYLQMYSRSRIMDERHANHRTQNVGAFWLVQRGMPMNRSIDLCVFFFYCIFLSALQLSWLNDQTLRKIPAYLD